MAVLTGLVRRTLWVLVLGLAGGAAYQWWRERQAPSAPAAPEWPPIDVPGHDMAATTPDAATTTGDAPTDTTTGDAPADTTTGDAPAGAAAETEPSIVPDPPVDDVPVGTVSIVNALVDAPEARSIEGDRAGWVDPDDDGSCPLSHPIKANDNSGIFHVPGGRFYDRTNAERCYADADAAVADGYRQAKS